MLCKYCGGAEVQEDKMCVTCKRRYNRYASNKFKFSRAKDDYERSKYFGKMLNDLSAYRRLQEADFVVPASIAADLALYAGAQKPEVTCKCCGATGISLHKGRSMCESCYRFCNKLNTLYYRPKYQKVSSTTFAYYEMLDEAYARYKKGHKLPGHIMGILKEEKFDIEC